MELGARLWWPQRFLPTCSSNGACVTCVSLIVGGFVGLEDLFLTQYILIAPPPVTPIINSPTTNKFFDNPPPPRKHPHPW